MRVKQYIDKYIGRGDVNAEVDLIAELRDEMRTMTVARKAQTPSAIIAVFNEVNDKYKRIAAVLGGKPDLFEYSIFSIYPEIMHTKALLTARARASTRY